MNGFRLSLLFILLGSAVLPCSAEVYRWVDDKGVTHYGDRPPKGSAAGAAPEVSKMDLGNSNFYSHVKKLVPIRYPAKDKAPLLLFNELQIKLSNAHRQDVDIGTWTTASAGSCTSPQPIIWSEGFVRVTEDEMMSDVTVAFREENYRMLTGNIMSVSNASSRLVLSATINRMRLDVCNRIYARHSSDEKYQKAAAFLHVQWRLTDRLSRQVLYETFSEGAENAFDRFKENGAAKAISRALVMAARNLLADKLFIDRLVQHGKQDTPAEQFDEMQITLNYGKAESSFKTQIDNLKAAAVVVRNPRGHGSGVLLDKKGYILTNAHVVGDSDEVIIIVNGLEFNGKVVRSEPLRDVALVKIQELTSVDGIQISRGKLTEGDTIYVIGTPLDEALSGTITKGVYSAFRSHDGLPFYQTDAAINPGNSGGPVFDERGELVAISVAGVFTRTGASLNVNYLIPIDDAFRALNLSKERDISHLLDVSDKADPATAKPTGNKAATDTYLAALEKKRLGNFSEARELLRQAMQKVNNKEPEYIVIRDELYVELPLSEARAAMLGGDEQRVGSILEPVIGFLKNHAKRVEYMRQVEEIRTGLTQVKKHRKIATENNADTVRRLMRQYQARHGHYPKTQDELARFLTLYQQLNEVVEIRFYKSDGRSYKLQIYDSKYSKLHTLEG